MRQIAKVITIIVLLLMAGTNVWGQVKSPLGECKRDGRDKTPLGGEYCCTAETGDLCWKSGPVKKGSVPHYYELTEEFKIDLKYYFTDPPPVQLPQLSKWNRKHHRKLCKAMVDELPDKDYIVPQYKWDFIRFSDGNLIIKKGYRWDGASRGLEGWQWETLLFHMRSSLVHDAFYDLLRFRALPPVGSHNRIQYRKLADHLFYLIAREDGQGKTAARTAYRILRDWGWRKADDHPEEDASWRFHTLANASVSSGDIEMDVDVDGTKKFTMSCALESDTVVLDASLSRPIANFPAPGKYVTNLHETTWEWFLIPPSERPLPPIPPISQLVELEKNHIATPLDPDTLKAELTVGELIDKGLVPGVPNVIILMIDKGKGEMFEDFDKVEVLITLDTVGPPDGVCGDVSISKTQEFDDRGGGVYWGDTISYSITIENLFNTAVDLMISDALSAFVEYMAGSFTVNDAEEDDPMISTEGLLGFEFEDLGAGETLTIAFDVTVKPEDLVPEGSWIENVAWVDVLIDEVLVIDDKLSNTVGVEVIPEPATIALLEIGLCGLLALVRRRRKLRK